jgi:hypothetical protein
MRQRARDEKEFKMTNLLIHASRVPDNFINGQVVHFAHLYNEQGFFGIVVSAQPFAGMESFSGNYDDSEEATLQIDFHEEDCECDDCRRIYSVYDQVRFI